MIAAFRSKSLADLWQTGRTGKIDGRLHQRILRRLEALDSAEKAEDMNVPGFNFHRLKGFNPARYTVHVNGPWCITFEFSDGEVRAIDFEDYH